MLSMIKKKHNTYKLPAEYDEKQMFLEYIFYKKYSSQHYNITYSNKCKCN